MTPSQIIALEAKIALTKRIESAMLGDAPKQPRTALAYRGGQFVSLPIDDNGKVIEPPPRCPNCGPILWCSKHTPF